MTRRADEPIAIVGLACRFPGAKDAAAFWQLLRDGVDAIGDVPADRWDVEALYDPDLLRPGSMSSRWGGFVDGVGELDAGFFGLSALEAAAMDPQQRLALEASWTAFEHAGIVPATLAATRGGVFMGVAYNDYAAGAFANPDNYSSYSPSGTELSMVPNRISHFYDLRGPSLAVNTGCSSSLVAVHLACQSLRSGESDHALAGGVSLILAPEPTIALSQAWMLAADGRCKAFDARADGYVRGEGCGVVVLRRLADARRDGDRVLAVIRGSAVNHGGRGAGLTAPNGAAQQSVLRAALAAAATAPCDLSYVEAHGVGTRLGDATEMAALQAVLAGDGGPCAIGSVKTNIGHLEWASGIASVIKTVLALQAETIPPHLHLTVLSPDIRLDGTRFVVPTAPLPWSRGANPRVAGVNSFGLGGTNAHVIIADDVEAPTLPAVTAAARPLVLALSARTSAALAKSASDHVAALDAADDAHALCATSNARRTHFPERAALVAADAAGLRERLVTVAAGETPADVERGRAGRPRVAFLFTGQGAQYPGMAATLAREEPVFREALAQCAALLDPLIGQPLFGLLAPGGDASSAIHQTQLAQPALFAVEYALAELWRSWGVVPAAMLGHSVGEYVAACVGGALSLKDATALIAERGRLMGSLPRGGAMVSVVEEEGVLRERLASFAGRIDVAAVNGPRNIVVSGAADAIDELVAALDDEFVATQRLTVSHAFHSPLMEPILDNFAAAAARVQFAPLCIPIASNVTGQMLEVGHLYGADYWRAHLRGAVRFCDGVRALAAGGIDTFLEIGPADTLSKLGRRCVEGAELRFIPSLRGNKPDWDTLAPALAALYARGAAVDWRAVEGERARRVVAAPSYPFERRRHWFTPAAAKSGLAAAPPAPSTESALVVELRGLSPNARRERLRTRVSSEVGALLGWPAERRPASDAGLFALGLTSLAAVELQARVQRALGGAVAIPPTTLFAHPTIDALVRFVLAALFPDQAAPVAVTAPTVASDEPIAIVGMGLRTPGGAANADELWTLLRDGIDATSDVPAARWDVDALYAADRSAPGRMYTRRGGFLGDVSGFDAELFGLSAREAEAMDPQQRLLLEVACEALDDAGYRREQLRDSATGVFVGIISNEYGSEVARPSTPESVDAYHVIGNIWSAVAGRVSYHLGLRGPSMAVDTACSSSLVAVHLAAQSLRAGECDRALAGGVNLILSPTGSLALCRAQALAGDGRCKTFDASADGYARGEGCGVVVLRRLSQALADGDRVLAVIRGSAVNHDGRSAGFTVPSGASQVEVVRSALGRAGVAPDEVDYIEAHGTGTPLGDPIEVGALAEVFSGRSTALRIGSVKTNLGHLEAAAGVMGLVKTVLALVHEALPPHLHLQRLNPHLPLAQLPIEIPRRLLAWPRGERPRIAGVSAFGMSGTNAHLLVEEAPLVLASAAAPVPIPIPIPIPIDDRLLPFVLSARTGDGLRAWAAAWSRWLETTPSALVDIAHTAAMRRTYHEHRLVVLARGKEALVEALRAIAAGASDERSDVVHGAAAADPPAVVLVVAEERDRAAALARLSEWGVEADAVVVAGAAVPETIAATATLRLSIGQGEEAALRAAAALTVAGVAVRFAALLPEGRIVSLPSYPWQRRRYWRSAAPAAAAGSRHHDGEPLPPPRADAIDEDALTLWELEMATPATPGTLLSLLGDLGRQRLGGDAMLVRDLRLKDVAAGQRLRLVARTRVAVLEVEIEARVDEATRWIRFATATVRRDPDDEAIAVPVPADATTRRALRHRLDGAIADLCGGAAADGPLSLAWARLREPGPATSTAPWATRSFGAAGAQLCQGDVVVAELQGARVARRFGAGARPAEVLRWLHGAVWQPRALGAGERPGRVVLLGGAGGLAEPLAARLLADGAEVLRALSDVTPIDADVVVDLRALGAAAPAEGALVDRALARAGDLLELAQRIVAAPGRKRLYIVTRRSASGVDGVALAAESAPLWGMVRALQHEHPEIAATLIDLGDDALGDVDALARELLAGARDTQVAIRGSRRLTPELRRLTLSASATAPSRAPAEAARLETRRPGFVDDVRFRQSARRAPEPDEIEVHVTHLPLSFLDVMRATGMNGESAQPLPLGHEWAGEVVRIGAAVTRVAVGDRAIGLAPGGVGTYVTVRAELAVVAPPGMPLARAATLPLAFALAHHVLVDVARLQPGERLLVHSATGAVGQACLQYARSIGAEVLATAGDEPRRQWLHGAGIREVFDSRTLSFVDDVRRATAGQGVDVVVSSVAGAAVAASRGLLRPFGRFVDIGRRRLRHARRSDEAEADNVVSTRVDLLAMMREQPARIARVLDAVVELVRSGALAPLDAELRPSTDAVGALRDMAQLRHLGKLVLTLDPPPRAEPDEPAPRLALRPGATYLVTGGLGGLGLRVARWLVERGARQIVLVGRRPPSAAAAEEIALLAAGGATVTSLAADLGVRGDVEALLAQLRRAHPPLAGIVHAAGVLDDAILPHQSRARLAAVFAAKAAGAWHLDELITEPLDFFVLFSSMASAIGSPGQVNYAAANAALDALAERRRAAGQPALSIQWGPWDEVGMAARGDRVARAASIGLRPLAPGDALAAMERLIGSSATQALVVDARWRQLSVALPGLERAWDLESLVEDEAPSGAVAPQAAARARLETAPASERRALIITWLREALAGVMRLSVDDIDPAMALDRLGLDSLAAVELNQRVQAGFGHALPVTELLRAPSLERLAAALLSALGLAHEPLAALSSSPKPAVAGPSWFVIGEPRPAAALRLICFPFAGGGPAIFRDWPGALPPAIEVVAAQLPGRGARIDEPPLTRMGPLAEALADALEPLLDRPFALFGHCMGALVMFEVARRLRQRGRPLPCHLFVSASPAPNGYLVPALDPDTGRYINARPGANQALVPVHALPPADFFDVLRFLNFGKTRVLLDDETLMRAVLPMVQADFEVCDRYRYRWEPPLPIPITAVGGEADPFATRTELLRWAKETDAPFELLLRPGDHYFLFPERRWLLDLIVRRALRAPRSGDTSGSASIPSSS